jgi:geranylgeranyl reductase family protein
MAAERDVIVVGGGPAGAATATHLARRGYSVLVVDREEFPRSKPCGECVNPAAVAALHRLGALPRVAAANPEPLGGWRIVAPNGTTFYGSFPSGGHGLAIPRAMLDSLLLEHARGAGAEVYTGARVVDVLTENGCAVGVRIAHGAATHQLTARLVVGADGLRSVVVRRLGLIRRRPRLRKIALTAHLQGVEGLGGSGELHVHPWGCIGIADLGEGAVNVTVVVGEDESAKVARDKAEYFDGTLARSGRFPRSERVDDVLATGPFDWPVRRAVADGVLLVGDAAGYYDPFTGQGIFRALRSAELAADVADAALRHGTVSSAALAPYDRARRREFAPGMGLQHVIEAVVSRPTLLNVMAGRFARHPPLADALIAVTGDLKPVTSLLQPRLLARLFV